MISVLVVALQKIDQLKPDLVTLDVEMPVLDGIGTLRELRKTHQRLPVIMFSTLTAAGAARSAEEVRVHRAHLVGQRR